MYWYGCVSEAKLSLSLSEKEADSTDSSTESVALQRFEAVMFRTWARSLTEGATGNDGCEVVV